MQKILRMLLWMMMCLSPAGIPVAVAAGEPAEVQRYVERRGEHAKPVLWRLTHDDGYQLIYQSPEETHVTQTDAALQTTSWHMSNALKEMVVQATREANAIALRGTCKGQAIQERFELDADPWFQATSLSLRDFVRSPENTITFWTLRPDTLKPLKLTATKVALETLKTADASVDALKIELRATGWRAPFWRSHYWFRASDGLLLRFEGQAGPSRANPIVIDYTGPGPVETSSALLPLFSLWQANQNLVFD
ncbi:MAG: hypothetical protein WAU91_00390 [Desulfatitalea sp.]